MVFVSLATLMDGQQVPFFAVYQLVAPSDGTGTALLLGCFSPS